MADKIDQVNGYDIDLPPDAETNQQSMGLNDPTGTKKVYLVYDASDAAIKFIFL